jgi:hypothetical protein
MSIIPRDPDSPSEAPALDPAEPFAALSAVRLAVRTTVRRPRPGLPLLDLACAIGRELAGHPWLRACAFDVLRSESAEYLRDGRTPGPPAVLYNPVRARLASLRHRRFERCPECSRRVPTLDELQTEEDRERADFLLGMAREDAPSREAEAALAGVSS